MKYNNRILIVDDNESIHKDFLKTLCKTVENDDDMASLEAELFGDDNSKTKREVKEESIEYQVDSAYQGEEALEKVRQAHAHGNPYALLFVDVRMPPGWDGIETISRIWSEFPYTEMAICTAYSDYSWEEIAEKLGNTDKLLFLTKPFSTIVVRQMALSLIKKWNLGEQARNYVADLENEVSERTQQLKSLLADVEQKNKLLQHMALHDGLTDLPNRTLFTDRLKHRVTTAGRENLRFAVFMLDLDQFKDINDTLGHEVGDKVLIEVGERIRQALRDSDTAARLGGDEFAVLLHEVDDESSTMVANKIVEALEPPIVVNNKSLCVGASIGIAVYPAHGEDDTTLVRHADIAMYEAKYSGQGVSVFDVEENAKRSDRAQLVKDFESAIHNRGLDVWYQPIVNTATREINGVEALCRWEHPERGMVPPDEFIPIAEQKGFIKPLTLLVLESALKQVKEWHSRGLYIGVSINLSARNFLDTELHSDLEQLLSTHDVDGKWLTLEITEGMTINNPERALRIMNTLTNMGVGLSIDDYGTGYSSLAYLKRLPVKEVKIDRSFVLDLDSDDQNKMIVQSTVELSHAMGMTVVAEGVENQGIMDILKNYGCDKVQGYHLCRPKDSASVTSWLVDKIKGSAEKSLDNVVRL